MSAQGLDTNAFWRAKYARQCTKRFQAEQILPILTETLPVIWDRPKLHEIPCPVPILQATAPPAETEQNVAGFASSLQAPAEAPVSTTAVEDPGRIVVGIIGAGAAGLYTAMILQDLGIDYEIIEGSERPGGRIRTHEFKDGKKPWNYFVSYPPG